MFSNSSTNKAFLKVGGIDCHRSIILNIPTFLRDETDNNVSSKGQVNDFKLDNNIIRAKSTVFQYADCNPWDYFVTLTFDKGKTDRTNIELLHKQLTKYISNFNARHNCNIKYLLIPELHQDGKNWHFHGLIHGLDTAYLHKLQIGDKMSKYQADCVRKGKIIYIWQNYEKKFGFCHFEPIQNQNAVSKYITKYFTKDLAKSITQLNAHLYYHSRGLKKNEKIKDGILSTDIGHITDEIFNGEISSAFSNEYFKKYVFPYDEERLELLKQCIFTESEVDYLYV